MYIDLFNCNYFLSYFVLYICKENWKLIGLLGKLKTNWSDHFVVEENVLDTDIVMSLQKIRGSRSRRRTVGLCYGIKHGHLNLGSVGVGEIGERQ